MERRTLTIDAEIASYLSGDPIDDNITAYTKVKSNLACSDDWGNSQNVYKNITFDTTFPLDSSKNYVIWFDHVSSNLSDTGSYTVRFDANASITHNYTGVRNIGTNDSYTRIPGLRFYNGTAGNTSNVWLEIGDIDGNHEWNFTGEFAHANMTDDFNSSLQSYIDNNCTSNIWENCSVPLKLHSDTLGKIEFSDINIQFTDYWWNTTNFISLETYKINATPVNTSANGTGGISSNDFNISHPAPNLTIGKNSSQIEYEVEGININWSASDDDLDSTIFNITYPNGSLLFSSTANSGDINLTSSVNLSVGYYNPHLKNEFVLLSDLERALNFTHAIIKNVDIKFKAPVKYSNIYYGYEHGYYEEKDFYYHDKYVNHYECAFCKNSSRIYYLPTLKAYICEECFRDLMGDIKYSTLQDIMQEEVLLEM